MCVYECVYTLAKATALSYKYSRTTMDVPAAVTCYDGSDAVTINNTSWPLCTELFLTGYGLIFPETKVSMSAMYI